MRNHRGNSDAKMLIVLTAFSAVAGLLLTLVDGATRDRIAAGKVLKQQKALMEVLPKFDTVETRILLPAPGDPVELFTCRTADGAVTGTAVKLSTRKLSAQELAALALPDATRQDQPFETPIKMLVGFTPEGKIHGISFLEQKETPGLGTNIEKKEFKDHFAGVPLDGKRFSVKKDGGDIPELTAATITSRAVTAAVTKAIHIYKTNAAGAPQATTPPGSVPAAAAAPAVGTPEPAPAAPPAPVEPPAGPGTN